VTDPLHRLLEIQEQDTLVDQVRHRRTHHPLQAELSTVEAELVDVGDRRDAAVVERDAIRRRQGDLESEVAANTERAATIERRMYSGEISAARDLQAMSNEADSLKGRTSRLEDLVLETMVELEPVEARATELEVAHATLAERASRLQVELSEADAVLAAEEAQHEAARRTLASDLAPQLLDRYDKLRSRLGGVAAASLHNGACGGCHLALPATELDRIRRAEPDALIFCEQCGRILVRP
jgi:uncharacterized protein